MGGGVSSAASEQMEEMMAYSVLLGRTITCLSFPGMHSILDFNLQPSGKLGKTHDKISKECARLTTDDADGVHSGESAASNGSSNESSEGPPPLIAADLADKFRIDIDGEVVILDDVTKQNEDGWTPLHACCHSNTTANIGIQILEEMVALGGDINAKTIRGPGGFNSGFTPLHMACAYGVADLVEALLKAGADPNCRNSFDWTPLLDVCHRGFAGIVASLVKAGAEVSHIPDEDACSSAHIMRGAPQSPLGEAARGGFKPICKFLLQSGSDKDQTNHLGWTPLHEACYFNHLDTVQLLLVHGADPVAKNGAIPYNMCSLQAIRDLLREIGGEEAAKAMPAPDFAICQNEKGQMFLRITVGKAEEASKGDSKSNADDGKDTPTRRGRTSSPSRCRNAGGGGRGGGEAGEAHDAKRALHSGGVLGDLPALGRPSGEDSDFFQ